MIYISVHFPCQLDHLSMFWIFFSSHWKWHSHPYLYQTRKRQSRSSPSHSLALVHVSGLVFAWNSWKSLANWIKLTSSSHNINFSQLFTSLLTFHLVQCPISISISDHLKTYLPLLFVSTEFEFFVCLQPHVELAVLGHVEITGLVAIAHWEGSSYIHLRYTGIGSLNQDTSWPDGVRLHTTFHLPLPPSITKITNQLETLRWQARARTQAQIWHRELR